MKNVLLLTTLLTILLTTLTTGTTTTLGDEPGEFLADTYVYGGNPNNNYGGSTFLYVHFNLDTYLTYIQYNISTLPNNITISHGEYCAYLLTNPTSTFNVSLFHLYDGILKNSTGNNNLNEGTITYNNQPCGTTQENNTNCNLTSTSSNEFTSSSPENTHYCWNIKPILDYEINNQTKTIAFSLMRSPPLRTGSTAVTFRPENFGIEAEQPYINLTYEHIYKPNSTNPYNKTPNTWNNTPSIFNITWNTQEGTIQTVTLESNYTGTPTNYTMNNPTGNVYNYSKTLPAGSFYWKSYANSTTGATNQTQKYAFTIQKAPNTCNLTIQASTTTTNQDNTGTSTETITTNATCQQGTTQLYYNNILVINPHTTTHGVGTQTYKTNTTGNQNYTSATQTNTLTITLPAEESTGGGGGGGRTTKKDCNIEIQTGKTNITDTDPLLEIIITNNENFTYTPDIQLQDQPTTLNPITQQLSIASAPGTIGPQQSKSFGIQYIGGFLGSTATQGTASMTLTHQECQDITLLFSVAITNNTNIWSQLFQNNNTPLFTKITTLLNEPLLPNNNIYIWQIFVITSIIMGTIILKQKYSKNETTNTIIKIGGWITSTSILTILIISITRASVGG